MRSSTISTSVASPVQRLITSTAIGSALNTRSGASSTQPCASFCTSRTPRGSRGRASGAMALAILVSLVVLEHTIEPLADDRRREQFGQAGGDRFEERLLAGEMDIGVDRKTRRREEATLRDHQVAIEPEPIGQTEPARDAAFVLAVAVVV